jgi:hypothetical protein
MTSDKICAYQKYGPGTLVLTFKGLKMTENVWELCVACVPRWMRVCYQRASQPDINLAIRNLKGTVSSNGDSTFVDIKEQKYERINDAAGF